MANAAELASESSTSLKGLLRIGVISIIGTHYLMPLLPNLLALHPQLSIQLVRATAASDVYSHQVDCALLPANLMEPTLAGRELRPNRMVVVATPDYIARQGSPLLPSDLHRHQCITLVQADGQELPWLFRAEQGEDAPEPRSVRIRGRIRTDDMEQVMAAALSGLGVARVPHLPVQHAIAAKCLVVLMPEYQAPGLSIWVAYPPRLALPKRLRVFIDFLLSAPLAPH